VPVWQQRFIAQWACTYGTWAFQQHTKSIECTTPKNSSSRRRVSGIAFRPCGPMMKSLLLKRAALVSGRVTDGRSGTATVDPRKLPYCSCRPGTEADVAWLLFLDRSAPSCCVTGGTELCAECRESVRDKDGNTLPFGPVFHLVDALFFVLPCHRAGTAPNVTTAVLSLMTDRKVQPYGLASRKNQCAGRVGVETYGIALKAKDPLSSRRRKGEVAPE
jgi:hypothetical protein